MTVTGWQKKLPMQFTMARIYAVPLIILAMYPNNLKWNIVSAILFTLASVTDYYDGYFARKYQAVSNMGKFMDPIADKILVTGVLIMLLYQSKVDPWMVLLILSRDTFIGGIRAVAAADQIIIDARPTGKWKTALQMVGIPALIIGEAEGNLLYVDKIGYALLWISVILSITSGVQYYLGYLKSRKAGS
jgi:CDP-diacylglycerol--glycerol-3-phosphate 3-phosphatidyltransferase